MKPKIAVIVAKASDHGIGCSEGLPWHIPGELKYFRERTLGKPVIMGRKTFDSIIDQFGSPLPKRENIVVSRSGYKNDKADKVCGSLEEAIQHATNIAQEKMLEEIFVIGGSDIFKQALASLADIVYLTKIDGVFKDANAFLYEEHLPDSVWKVNNHLSQSKTLVETETQTDVKCDFLVLERRNQSSNNFV